MIELPAGADSNSGNDRITPLRERVDTPSRRRPTALSAEAETFLATFGAHYSLDHVLDWLEKVRALRILFIGESIIDEYQYCETLGKSGKEPILAARYLSSEKFAGGILAIANQAAVLCHHVGLVSLLGTRDSHEEFIRQRLDPRIEAVFLPMPGSPTIVKQRLVEVYPFQKLFEIYHMDPVVADDVSRALFVRLEELLPQYDAVSVADYGHGMLTPEIVELLCAQDSFLTVNTQANAANQGFHTISKYRRANYVCLSERELRLDARSPSRDPRLIMAEAAQRLGCQRMLITRGREGCLCYDATDGCRPIPPFTNRIVDRIGAGDALFAVTSLCAALQAPIDMLGFLGNVVGAQAVETVGNRSVIPRDRLLAEVESLLDDPRRQPGSR